MHHMTLLGNTKNNCGTSVESFAKELHVIAKSPLLEEYLTHYLQTIP